MPIRPRVSPGMSSNLLSWNRRSRFVDSHERENCHHYGHVGRAAGRRGRAEIRPSFSMRAQYLILLAAIVVPGCASSPKDAAAIHRDARQQYTRLVRNYYAQAWQPTDIVTTNAAIQSVTRVSVAVAKNGSVISAKIVKPSGDERMDKSVQSVLDRIKCVPPFESGANDKRRTFTMNFVESEELAPMPDRPARDMVAAPMISAGP